MPKLLVQNYGLFWTKNKVFWGRGQNRGHLRGVRAGKRTGQPVDFREQQGVYVLYDDNFRLIYVGRAGSSENDRLFKRLRHHLRDKLADRWTRFSWFGIRRVLKSSPLSAVVIRTSVAPRVVLNQVEAILISSTEPPLNLQGGRFGKDVKRYLQHQDSTERGPGTEIMIHEIWKSLSKVKKNS